MVVSFFRKQAPPQKMPERPVARPRPPAPENPQPAVPDALGPASAPLADLDFSAVGTPISPTPAQRSLVTVEDEGFGEEFTESRVMAIDVDHDFDPIQSDVEQAAVLFANGQDVAARALLESFIQTYPGREGLRFWHLLFDLLQVLDEREAFEQLGVRFAEACEMSPPAWRFERELARVEPGAGRRLVLQGVLTSAEASVLGELQQAVASGDDLIVDCGKLLGCDDDIAGDLARLLQQARSSKRPLRLDNIEGFLHRLNERLVTGKAEHAPAWLLLLELLQRHGTQARFEERAVDYAVSFELSPPSWEVSAAVPELAAPALPSDGTYYLSGVLKSCRFESLDAYLQNTPNPLIDCAGVRRIDFFSAGQLVNRIAPLKAAGKEVTIRGPNHLVAELMAVVGLNKQARIIVPKS